MGRRLLFVFLALSLVSTVFSTPIFAAGGIQGNLNGTVLDAANDKPVADVRVIARSPSGTFTASTDAAGRFTMLGLPPDMYTVDFSQAGYAPTSVPGVAVFGDQTNSVGVVRLYKQELQTIARVRSSARSGAFQPTQTQDTTTITGARIIQALGNSQSTNEQNLILAAPGAVADVNNNITVRGSLNVELGYQYDGINFTVPFFDGNGSSGYLNNIAGGSGGSLQVVSGAGDATQGNIGAGVINIVPPRGTYPANSMMGFQVQSPYYLHQFDFNYSWSTPNNKISDYAAFDGSSSVPSYYPIGAPAADIQLSAANPGNGQYYGTGFTSHRDFQNNFVFRFGHNNNMALQWLYRDEWQNSWGNYGGLAGAAYYPNNPLAYFPWNFIFPGDINQLNSVSYLTPPLTSVNQVPLTAEETLYQPLAFNKLGYTWNINSSTFMNLSWANFYQQSGSTNYNQGTNPNLVEIGGQRVFGEADLTHQFGSNHTTTLAIRYEDDLPRWYQDGPYFADCALSTFCGGGNTGNPYAPDVGDWYLPADPTQIGKPISAGNPCQTNPLTSTVGSCYIYQYLVTSGKWNGSLPLIPTGGIDYHHAIFHESGIGLRDQWDVNARLHLDYGIRLDADNLDWGLNQFGGPTPADALANPSDIPANSWGNEFLRPRIFEPRFAASYRVGSNDAFRFAYGRSVEFFFAQTAGTPLNLTHVNPLLLNMPAKDSAAGAALLGLSPAAVGTCGSGDNNAYPGPGGTTVPYWPCANYAQQLYWYVDQCCDAPDMGGQGPPTYNNWDLAWSHQFTKGFMDGWGLKLTGFARRGYNVEENTLLSNGPPNPVTGQTSASIFATRANGVEKTSGLEFMLTTPERPQGLSGFLTMNYVSEFSSSPPVALGGNFATDQLPILSQFYFNSGQMYRSGFIPPFQGRMGITYQAGPWKINPIISFDTGYPIGVGRDTYTGINGVDLWIPATNIPGDGPIGGVNGAGNTYNSPAFVDPSLPGSSLNPNIAATRGFDEPALPGGKLTKPHGYLDLDFEYTMKNAGLTFGMYIANVFNNHYGIWFPNTKYQPVATGISGPQTGQNASAYPGSATYIAGARDYYVGNWSYYPFEVPYGTTPSTTIQIYLQHRM
jgi:hypothetical protein